ncbi:hypothetical protein Q1695_006478 [Nippostrongylus brasiliensis]|nr:hypothetical protein Q1695_006478 [Nippostrongylus brasiliensis]
MISSIREADVQQCILRNSAVQQLAWQTIGTLGIELIVGINLTLAAVRLVTVFFGDRQAEKTAIVGISASVLWAISLTLMHQYGLVTRIWYDKDNSYRDQYLVPFNVIRVGLLVTEIVLTFLLYIGTLARIRKESHRGKAATRREVRFFCLSLIVFASELIYLYATFWIGFNYLHIGDAKFNANFNYVVRPIAAGITPVLYIVFSSEIRHLVRRALLCSKKEGRTITIASHS